MPLYNRLPRRFALFLEAAIPALLVLAIVGIGYVKVSANSNARERDNATRCAVVGLVAKLTENSSRAMRATIDSPTATEAQKRAAQINLNGIIATLHTTEAELKNPHGAACTLPDR